MSQFTKNLIENLKSYKEKIDFLNTQNEILLENLLEIQTLLIGFATNKRIDASRENHPLTEYEDLLYILSKVLDFNTNVSNTPIKPMNEQGWETIKDVVKLLEKIENLAKEEERKESKVQDSESKAALEELAQIFKKQCMEDPEFNS